MKTTTKAKTARTAGAKASGKAMPTAGQAPDVSLTRRKGVEDFGMFVELKTHLTPPQIPALFKAIKRVD